MPEFRTYSVDYVTPQQLDPADWDCLHDDIVNVFEKYGCKVDGAAEMPTDEFYAGSFHAENAATNEALTADPLAGYEYRRRASLVPGRVGWVIGFGWVSEKGFPLESNWTSWRPTRRMAEARARRFIRREDAAEARDARTVHIEGRNKSTISPQSEDSEGRYTYPLDGVDVMNDLARTLHEEVERIWPTPSGSDVMQRQALALCEEVGEIARAILKRSHAMRSPDGIHKGKTAVEWTDELHVEIGQTIGVALQLAHIEGINVDRMMAATVDALANRPCILHAATSEGRSDA